MDKTFGRCKSDKTDFLSFRFPVIHQSAFYRLNNFPVKLFSEI